jgi:hypothetical protein
LKRVLGFRFRFRDSLYQQQTFTAEVAYSQIRPDEPPPIRSAELIEFASFQSISVFLISIGAGERAWLRVRWPFFLMINAGGSCEISLAFLRDTA